MRLCLTGAVYAYDLLIISPSIKGLQSLLGICALNGQNHDILFNHAFEVKLYLNTPIVPLYGNKLAFVLNYKYMATIVTCDATYDLTGFNRIAIHFPCVGSWMASGQGSLWLI